jgi:uncharacterized protein
MVSALKRNLKGAAGCAALFAFFLWAVMPAYMTFTPVALAKMRTDQLAIEKSGGGAPVTITVERADTDQEKALGLMFRTELRDNEGMLFNYGRSFNVTMWMRNTYIPLDMVFIRSDGIIHRIEVRAEPLSERVISSGGDVSAVLEIAGGASERLGIKAGDKVRHKIFESAAAPK